MSQCLIRRCCRVSVLWTAVLAILLVPKPLLPQTTLQQADINVGFVPGDSFFLVHIPENMGATAYLESLIEESAETGTIVLNYDYPKIEQRKLTVFRAGFESLEASGFSQEAGRLLLRAVASAEAESRVLIEQGQIDGLDSESFDSCSLLIYNRGLDFVRFKPFLRFNENWRNGGVEGKAHLAASDPQRIPFNDLLKLAYPNRYQPHVWTPEAVMTDWRDANEAPALKVQVPEVLRSSSAGPVQVSTPVKMKCRDLAFVVFPYTSPERAFRQLLNSTFYSADSHEAVLYRWVVSDDFENRLRREVLISVDELESQSTIE